MNLERTREIFIRHYIRLRGQPIPAFTIQYYPYANLNHTIRLRDGRILVRISDILDDAPEIIFDALLSILLHRLFGTRPRKQDRHIYQKFIRRDDMRRKVRQVRAKRGRKYLSGPKGKVFDLENVFRRLNERYFSNQLQVEHLSWSRQNSRRVLGHYDPAHNAIVISRRLDDPSVPRFVIDYVMYHEMLHLLLDDCGPGHRRHIHTPEFRRAEKGFHQYAEAQAFLNSHYAAEPNADEKCRLDSGRNIRL